MAIIAGAAICRFTCSAAYAADQASALGHRRQCWQRGGDRADRHPDPRRGGDVRILLRADSGSAREALMA